MLRRAMGPMGLGGRLLSRAVVPDTSLRTLKAPYGQHTLSSLFEWGNKQMCSQPLVSSVHDDKHLTWGQVKAKSEAIARMLIARKLSMNKPLLLIQHSSTNLLVLQLAASLSGIPAVVVDPSKVKTGPELAELLEHFRPQFVFADPSATPPEWYGSIEEGDKGGKKKKKKKEAGGNKREVLQALLDQTTDYPLSSLKGLTYRSRRYRKFLKTVYFTLSGSDFMPYPPTSRDGMPPPASNWGDPVSGYHDLDPLVTWRAAQPGPFNNVMWEDPLAFMRSTVHPGFPLTMFMGPGSEGKPMCTTYTHLHILGGAKCLTSHLGLCAGDIVHVMPGAGQNVVGVVAFAACIATGACLSWTSPSALQRDIAAHHKVNEGGNHFVLMNKSDASALAGLKTGDGDAQLTDLAAPIGGGAIFTDLKEDRLGQEEMEDICFHLAGICSQSTQPRLHSFFGTQDSCFMGFAHPSIDCRDLESEQPTGFTPAKGVQCSITDANGSLREDGSWGQLRMRGSHITDRYWNFIGHMHKETNLLEFVDIGLSGRVVQGEGGSGKHIEVKEGAVSIENLAL